VLSAPAQFAGPTGWRADRDYTSASAKQVDHKENVKRKLDQFQFNAAVDEVGDTAYMSNSLLTT
jgi:hypothetical protein